MSSRTRVQLRDRRAFTALELIIVVVIIGILAAAGMSKYKNFTVQARKNACISNQEQITSAIRLCENDLGPLAQNTVIRIRVTGEIDGTRCVLSPTQTASTYGVWINTVPTSWGVTNANNNAKILEKSQEMKIFRCLEDSNLLSPTYDATSSFPGATGAIAATGDRMAYTFAKLYKDNATGYGRAAFAAAVPSTSNDPLEGYNWLTNAIEWRNTSFTFCRRWGLRNPNATGFAVASLNGNATDLLRYVPGGQEVRLAHSAYAPIQ